MALNKRRILALAKMLRAKRNPVFKGKPVGFNMAVFDPSPVYRDRTGKRCGTACCIAGWTVLKYGHEDQKGDADSYIAGELLGLTPEQADMLFNPFQVAVCDWENISPKRAARTLERLAETGEVKW